MANQVRSGSSSNAGTCLPCEGEEADSVAHGRGWFVVVLVISGDEPSADGTFYDCEEDNETEYDCVQDRSTMHFGREQAEKLTGMAPTDMTAEFNHVSRGFVVQTLRG